MYVQSLYSYRYDKKGVLKYFVNVLHIMFIIVKTDFNNTYIFDVITANA